MSKPSSRKTYAIIEELFDEIPRVATPTAVEALFLVLKAVLRRKPPALWGQFVRHLRDDALVGDALAALAAAEAVIVRAALEARGLRPPG